MAALPGVDTHRIDGVQPSNAALSLQAPHRLWAFVLPLPRTPLPDAPNKVGDRFAAVGVAIEALKPEGVCGDLAPRPVFYRLARADLGAPTAAQIASPKTAALLPWSQAKWTPLQTGDVWHLANGWIRSVGDEGETATYPSDWPPLHMDFIDAEVGERWYAVKAQRSPSPEPRQQSRHHHRATRSRQCPPGLGLAPSQRAWATTRQSDDSASPR